MKKILISLMICGLSVSGSCFGFFNDGPKTRGQSGNLKSNLVEVVDANASFLRDYKNLKSDKLARKYGTQDGIVYRMKDGKNAFLRYEDTPSKKASFCSSYYGDPIEGLEALEKFWDNSKKLEDFS